MKTKSRRLGANDENLRLCGLVEDDDEDMSDALDALFGDGDDDEPGVVDDGNGKCPCPSTLPIWYDFVKLFKIENGKKARYGAKCNHCDKQ